MIDFTIFHSFMLSLMGCPFFAGAKKRQTKKAEMEKKFNFFGMEWFRGEEPPAHNPLFMNKKATPLRQFIHSTRQRRASVELNELLACRAAGAAW